MKNACMTRQTLLMFPQMKFLTENSLLAATAIASGETPEHVEGFEVLGRGAFTKAFGNDDYVVKGEFIADGQRDNSAAWNYRTWFKNSFRARASSKLFNKTCKRFLAPTVVLYDCVVVQEKVKWMGNRFSMELCFAVEDLAMMLGIVDMHGANWGVNAAGEVKLFDIMPRRGWGGKNFTADVELQKCIDKVETLVRQEVARKIAREVR